MNIFQPPSVSAASFNICESRFALGILLADLGKRFGGSVQLAGAVPVPLDRLGSSKLAGGNGPGHMDGGQRQTTGCEGSAPRDGFNPRRGADPLA